MRSLTCRPPGTAPTGIRIGRGLRHRLAGLIGSDDTGRFALVDRRVAERHPELRPDGPHLELPGGEELKDVRHLEQVLRALAGAALDRGARLVAIGGGSVGDLGGTAAALFLRGIRVVQVPTTLLAMIDSSVGGKTAINLPEGKNLVGAFHPPELVIADVELLAGLPGPEFRSGLGEAVKMAIGVDAGLFELLESRPEAVTARDPEVLEDLVARAVQAKIDVVEDDPREDGPRRVLNLGHTFGHALEAHTGYRVPHGVAVARGLHAALDLSAQRGRIDGESRRRCAALLAAYGFAPDPLPPFQELLPFLERDKKMRDGRLHMVLPTGIGSCTVEPVTLDELAPRP